MTEPSGHCPYLGLKQNRAIRFASPTPEHRCYAGGEPSEIPVDQASFCLSQGHVHCPLYMGLTVPTTGDTIVAPVAAPAAAPRGVRGWLATLPPRDRTIYSLMLGMLALIIAIYLVAGVQSFASLLSNRVASGATERPAPTSAAAGLDSPPSTSLPTGVPPTPTDLPTSAPTAEPSAQPTRLPLIIPPTQIATAPADELPTSVAPTARPTEAPARPTSAAPTARPTSVAPTARPTSQAASPTSAPTAAPSVDLSNQTLTVYFSDATNSLFVPVQRTVQVENMQVARAAVEELIDGPRGRLSGVLSPDTRLIDLQIESGTATVNFDRRPTERGLSATVLTLTQFSSIQRVQFKVNGQNIGIDGTGPVARPVINPINPENLPLDTRQTEFLPIYFTSPDGAYDVRFIRMVPKTRETARATVNALLDGPDSYAYAVQRVIPEGTALRDIRMDSQTGIVTVDFNQRFADATKREDAVRNVVQSLTTLPNVTGVQFLVEGQPLADVWGEEYRSGFGPPLLNTEE